MNEPAPGRWGGHGFGLALQASFPIAGCPSATPPRDLPLVTLEPSHRAALRRALGPGSTVIARRRGQDGTLVPDVRAHPSDGYLIDEGSVGVFHIAADGERVRCATGSVAAWRWQRHLIGRVLPFVSTLRGLEPWHASATVLSGTAIALVGASGAGKSTIAAQLLLAGGRLLADDVVALATTPAGALAHPGLGLMSLRRAAVARLERGALGALGARIGADANSIRLAVARHEQPLPLGAVYVLRQADELRLEPEPEPDPRLLLGSTFNLALQGPERLTRQLDVCAAIARGARIVHLGVPAGGDPRVVAEALLEDVNHTVPS